MIYEKSPGAFFSRQSCGGSVMVWAAFNFNGQVGLAFLDGRQNSPKYIETLENLLMPFAENIGERNWGDKGPATLLLRMAQTCSIGFMSGEYAGQFIRRIPSSKRKLSTSQARCDLALLTMRMDSSPIAAA
ncbi:hypothetical protein AVEN_4744-1 [Araneus ventricosus]|uniref:Transposable element Tc3 transposase n=1 Tax=Araneus ventricosus TaxID=182803 RepID=A0A4Y2KEG3_ARAVE|nr:hypothetical protein AVEN_4744-1 [Araneus ventricosus]